jgi:hypothetical protein
MKKLAIAVFFLAFSLPALGQVLASFNETGLTYGHVHLNVSQSDFERHKEIWVEHFGGRVVEKGRNALPKFPCGVRSQIERHSDERAHTLDRFH